MSKILPANRVAALATWLAGIGTFVASVESTLPKSWQNAALGAVGIITSTVTALHYMSGSQKFDALQVKREVFTRASGPVSNPAGTVPVDIGPVSFEDALADPDPGYDPVNAGHPNGIEAT
jgi:hypothetical protein